ncbi:MAG: flagellar FlbD family protein [Lachnospiraceae bacterium]|nr:flagellar FlbD family protein [Lachnospiraceae bacterium]
MIKVIGLDGTTWYLNYFQILCIEEIPETKILLNNKQYYLVKDSVESIQKQIVAFLHSCVSPKERELLWERQD